MKNDSAVTIAQLKELHKKFVVERDWMQFHDPKNLSMSIAIEAAELMEKFQFVSNQESIELVKKHKQEVSHELVDVLSYVVAFANACAIDLTSAFQEKMALNAQKYPIDLAKGTHLKYSKLKK